LQTDYQRCKSGSYVAKRFAALEVPELRSKVNSCIAEFLCETAPNSIRSIPGLIFLYQERQMRLQRLDGIWTPPADWPCGRSRRSTHTPLPFEFQWSRMATTATKLFSAPTESGSITSTEDRKINLLPQPSRGRLGRHTRGRLKPAFHLQLFRVLLSTAELAPISILSFVFSYFHALTHEILPEICEKPTSIWGVDQGFLRLLL